MNDNARASNTRHLLAASRGEDPSGSLDALFTVCQRELREAASRLMRTEREGHTLQPTALVHEAYLRLFDVAALTPESRTHFLNLAARSMRQVLIDHARRHNAAKRGGGTPAVALAELQLPDGRRDVELIELVDALETLAGLDPRAARIVELRLLGGLTMNEIADLVGVSRRTVQKDWRFATMWLRREFTGGGARG